MVDLEVNLSVIEEEEDSEVAALEAIAEGLVIEVVVDSVVALVVAMEVSVVDSVKGGMIIRVALGWGISLIIMFSCADFETTGDVGEVLVSTKVVGSAINSTTGMAILLALGVLVVLQEVMVDLEEGSEVTLNEKVLVGTTIVTPSVHGIDSPVQVERYSSWHLMCS